MKVFRREAALLLSRANVVFKLEVEIIISPLFYIYIILLVLTAHSDTLSGTSSH